MFFHNNLITDRQSESGAFTNGFGGEKGIKNFSLNRLTDAGAVIANVNGNPIIFF